MEKAAAVFVYLSGISFTTVGAYLLHKASRTRGILAFSLASAALIGPLSDRGELSPDASIGIVFSLMLGLAFLFNGISYGFSEVPFVFGAEGLLDEMSFIGRIWASGCVIAIASFTYRVFRPAAKWARWFVRLDAALIGLALGVSAFEGDWSGLAPLTCKGYWIEWVASIVPFIWLAVEALGLYFASRERVRLGLIDPLVCNRYFLVGLYGALASISYFVLAFMYIGYERHGTWSASLDVALGTVEIVSVIALWISFRAPHFYRRWVGATETPTP